MKKKMIQIQDRKDVSGWTSSQIARVNRALNGINIGSPKPKPRYPKVRK